MHMTSSPEPVDKEQTVGSFTGFSNFFSKEVQDWWKSWRLIIIFAIPTLILMLQVFFAYSHLLQMFKDQPPEGQERLKQVLGTGMLLGLLINPGQTVLLIFILIFSSMGILTNEKSTGTLAWNLTKPLGRTGLFVAKWLVATIMIWVAMVVLPVIVASLSMMAYHRVTPDFAMMAPIVAAAFAWIGLWILLVLTISLGFQSQGAVGGITIAFWAVPNLLGLLMGEVLGNDTRDWILDRLATNAPFFAPQILGDKDLFFFRKAPEWKTVWLYSFAAWIFVLSVFSLRIFNRQEVGS